MKLVIFLTGSFLSLNKINKSLIVTDEVAGFVNAIQNNVPAIDLLSIMYSFRF